MKKLWKLSSLVHQAYARGDARLVKCLLSKAEFYQNSHFLRYASFLAKKDA